MAVTKKRYYRKAFILSLLLLAGIMLCATPSFAGKPLGAKCAGHYECTSGRCDNRAQAGCVPQDGTGKPNEFCTTHQQCSSQLCSITPGKITGTCGGSSKPLGAACSSHNECVSRRCDNRPGSGCVPQDGTGNANDFCSTHQQCRSQMCSVAAGKIAGRCSAASSKPLGTACSSHNECVSQRCDNRQGAGCVAQDGTGRPNDFCTTHQQCSSGYCQVAGGLRGTCSAGNQAIGRPCHASSECTSKYCSNGTCAQPGAPPQQQSTGCPGPKNFPGYTYQGQPSCAGVMGSYMRCDAKGYFCCATSNGSQSPRCGGANKYEFQAGCTAWGSGGGSNVEPKIENGIFYGCYKKN